MTFAEEQQTFNNLGARADAAILSLQSELDSAVEARDEAQTRVSELENALDQATSDASASASTITDLRSRLDSAFRSLAETQASATALSTQVVDLKTQVAARDQTIADLRAQLSTPSPTVPAGFTTLSTFPGATWYDKLANASGDVYVPAADVTDIDASWTDTRRQLVTIAKPVTRLRFEPGATLRLRKMTSKYWTRAMIAAQATTPLSIIQQTSGLLKEFSGLTVIGSDQGHHYHGFSFFNCRDLKSVEISIGGANQGYGGAPPDETFGGTVRGATDCKITLTKATGAFEDGTNISSVGFTFQQCLRCVLVNPQVSGWRASSIVFYQSAFCGIEGGRLERLTSNPEFGSGCHLNLEQTVGTYLKNVEFVGGVAGSDVTISMAGDQSTLTVGTPAESFSLKDAMVILDDCKGGAEWPGSTKNGMVTFRYWGQAVTSLVNGVRVLNKKFQQPPAGTDAATAARDYPYASKGITLANVDAKGYPLMAGSHWAYDGNPAGVLRTGLSRQNGQGVPSFTSAYGKTMVGVGGQPVPTTL